MKNIIHIFGASGSGTSTLGRSICNRLGYRFMDTDDYLWLPTDPQYTTMRDAEERVRLMRQDIDSSDNVVISGSLVDWGDVLISEFTLAVRLITPTDIRIERIKKREIARFGKRIQPGGDMYEQHLAFLDWAASYDDGSPDTKSRANHDNWQNKLPCKTIVLDGTLSVDELTDAVINCIEY